MIAIMRLGDDDDDDDGMSGESKGELFNKKKLLVRFCLEVFFLFVVVEKNKSSGCI